MVWDRVNEARIAVKMRLLNAARRLWQCGEIGKCGLVLLALGLAGLAPQAIAQSFPAKFELSDLLPINGGDGTEGIYLRGINDSDESGISVSGAGDVNGDGIDDFIIGARRAEQLGTFHNGESYVVFGRNTGFPAHFKLRRLGSEIFGGGTEGFVLQGAHSDDQSGYSVSDAGDVNGDGIDDIIIGAVGAHMGSGASYVVFGRNTSFPATFELSSLLPSKGGDGTEGFVVKGIDLEDNSGLPVSGAGDVNGDGIDDLIIGASNADSNGASDAGESYVIFGRDTGFPATFELRDLLPSAGGDGTEGFVLKGIDSGNVPPPVEIGSAGIAC